MSFTYNISIESVLDAADELEKINKKLDEIQNSDALELLTQLFHDTEYKGRYAEHFLHDLKCVVRDRMADECISSDMLSALTSYKQVIQARFYKMASAMGYFVGYCDDFRYEYPGLALLSLCIVVSIIGLGLSAMLYIPGAKAESLTSKPNDPQEGSEASDAELILFPRMPAASASVSAIKHFLDSHPDIRSEAFEHSWMSHHPDNLPLQLTDYEKKQKNPDAIKHFLRNPMDVDSFDIMINKNPYLMETIFKGGLYKKEYYHLFSSDAFINYLNVEDLLEKFLIYVINNNEKVLRKEFTFPFDFLDFSYQKSENKKIFINNIQVMISENKIINEKKEELIDIFKKKYSIIPLSSGKIMLDFYSYAFKLSKDASLNPFYIIMIKTNKFSKPFIDSLINKIYINDIVVFSNIMMQGQFKNSEEINFLLKSWNIKESSVLSFGGYKFTIGDMLKMASRGSTPNYYESRLAQQLHRREYYLDISVKEFDEIMHRIPRDYYESQELESIEKIEAVIQLEAYCRRFIRLFNHAVSFMPSGWSVVMLVGFTLSMLKLANTVKIAFTNRALQPQQLATPVLHSSRSTKRRLQRSLLTPNTPRAKESSPARSAPFIASQTQDKAASSVAVSAASQSELEIYEAGRQFPKHISYTRLIDFIKIYRDSDGHFKTDVLISQIKKKLGTIKIAKATHNILVAIAALSDALRNMSDETVFTKEIRQHWDKLNVLCRQATRENRILIELIDNPESLVQEVSSSASSKASKKSHKISKTKSKKITPRHPVVASDSDVKETQVLSLSSQRHDAQAASSVPLGQTRFDDEARSFDWVEFAKSRGVAASSSSSRSSKEIAIRVDLSTANWQLYLARVFGNTKAKALLINSKANMMTQLSFMYQLFRVMQVLADRKCKNYFSNVPEGLPSTAWQLRNILCYAMQKIRFEHLAELYTIVTSTRPDALNTALQASLLYQTFAADIMERRPKSALMSHSLHASSSAETNQEQINLTIKYIRNDLLEMRQWAKQGTSQDTVRAICMQTIAIRTYLREPGVVSAIISTDEDKNIGAAIDICFKDISRQANLTAHELAHLPSNDQRVRGILKPFFLQVPKIIEVIERYLIAAGALSPAEQDDFIGVVDGGHVDGGCKLTGAR